MQLFPDHWPQDVGQSMDFQLSLPATRHRLLATTVLQLQTSDTLTFTPSATVDGGALCHVQTISAMQFMQTTDFWVGQTTND